MQELTKETLRTWLDAHPATSPRKLSEEAGLTPVYITQLYSKNKQIGRKAAEKLLPVLIRYGWE